jgi:hypothetical protein
MRRRIFSGYLHEHEIYEIIGHDMFVYLRIGLKYLLVVGLLYGIYYFLSGYVRSSTLNRVFGGLGVIIYFKAMIDLIDEYLDALVITNFGLVLFRRDGLFKYKTIILQRVAIETVTDQQHGIRDSIFSMGDIEIRLEDTIHKFEDLQRPAQQVHKILTYKEKILGRDVYSENDADPGPDKYELLVEALGEVVTEYVDKKNQSRL